MEITNCLLSIKCRKERSTAPGGPDLHGNWARPALLSPDTAEEKSLRVKELAEIPPTCLPCTPCLSTTTRTAGRAISRGHREEGVATRAITLSKKKKNSAIVRVCQLRMIVWLVEPPPVFSAERLSC